jgi:cytochrome c oxidase subunit II
MSEERLQSVLHAAPGSGAALLQDLGIALYIGAAVIFVSVMGLVLHATFSDKLRTSTRAWVVGGGIVFPAVTLFILLSYSLAVGSAVSALHAGTALRLLLDCFGIDAQERIPPPVSGAVRIHVVGKQWWWEVRYEGARGEADRVVLANELRIPTDEPVELVLTTSDVIHSFWAPSLAGKVDMIPGRTNRLVLRTSEPGIYRGQCAEYCGGQHALMSMYVIAEPRDRFESWLLREAQPASMPEDPFLRSGYQAFFRGRCAECHTVRGTAAQGQNGPDLTHVGARHSLAAGVLRNHVGTMAGWIAGAQDVKPGNAMPDSEIYTGRELRALSAWLESLK